MVNDGTVVACHSNQQRDGKGIGLKAHDYRIGFGCSKCHFILDESKNHTREQKIELFEKMHRATIGWLFEAGHIKIV